MTNWQDAVAQTMMNTFGPSRAHLDRGQGAHAWDVTGKRYLDFLAGIAVNSLGHAHPAFVAAVSEQAGRIAHVSNLFTSPPQLAAAERIVAIAGTGPSTRVFFANSGTEANEAAFKLARLHGGAARPRIIALDNGFHGRTMGALALTGKPVLHAGFEPLPGGVEHIPATIEALRGAIGPDVAAVLVEPIQGEAGVRELPAGYLEEARELTRAHGALLIIDEIQTGIGRTGAWFGFQHAGIVPDAFTLAKGLGGGFPIGALVTTGAASELLHPGQHGTTFGGNPLATAVASAVIDTIEGEDLVAGATRSGEALRAAVASWKSPLVSEVRGRGLLLGIGLTAPLAADIQARAQAAGLIVNAPTPDTIRLAPPLIIGAAEIEEFSTIMSGVLAALVSEQEHTA